VRLALGAGARRITALVLRRGMGTAAAGVVLGLAMAWVAGSRVQPLLFHESGRDPVVLASVALLLVVVSAVASWVPAQRARRVNPMEALRSE
jgi:putative ABC transport system permease protein